MHSFIGFGGGVDVAELGRGVWSSAGACRSVRTRWNVDLCGASPVRSGSTHRSGAISFSVWQPRGGRIPRLVADFSVPRPCRSRGATELRRGFPPPEWAAAWYQLWTAPFAAV